MAVLLRADDDPPLARDREVGAEAAQELRLAIRAASDLGDQLGGAVLGRERHHLALLVPAAGEQQGPAHGVGVPAGGKPDLWRLIVEQPRPLLP
ncbi:hypothetical protein ABT150_30410 [Streptomyces mirabilis]|uniref:hypothetical protein n=1 Tax=Streptomyces mirabilis TaxID=68239 RepID=UPI00332D97F6